MTIDSHHGGHAVDVAVELDKSSRHRRTVERRPARHGTAVHSKAQHHHQQQQQTGEDTLRQKVTMREQGVLLLNVPH